jgi:CheY-like chemotaxis protein
MHSAYEVRSSSVLIVEDDDDVREAIADTVSRAGYRVATARHGGEALAYLERADPSPDMVLLDLMMPVVDGWTVLGEMYAKTPSIPVVVVSATREPRLPAAIPHLLKPVRRDELLAAIDLRCPLQTIVAAPKVVLTLHVRARCVQSSRARQVLAQVLARFYVDEISCQVVVGDDAPTLTIEHPLRLAIPGGPSDPRFLTMMFDVAEVQRRRP